jgi:Sulfotransferase domain
MKVIGAGFGRTGTRTLKTALELLGVAPCYHMSQVFEHPDHAPVWTRALDNETVNWDVLLGAYKAAVDWPVCTFYAQLMAAHPDAKVVLSVRDNTAWYESALETIYAMSGPHGDPMNWAGDQAGPWEMRPSLIGGS